MLGADVGKAPHAAEDCRVSAPVVTVESSKQFTTYMDVSLNIKSGFISRYNGEL
jgi:hypothetical protein